MEMPCCLIPFTGVRLYIKASWVFKLHVRCNFAVWTWNAGMSFKGKKITAQLHISDLSNSKPCSHTGSQLGSWPQMWKLQWTVSMLTFRIACVSSVVLWFCSSVDAAGETRITMGHASQWAGLSCSRKTWASARKDFSAVFLGTLQTDRVSKGKLGGDGKEGHAKALSQTIHSILIKWLYPGSIV